jgi:hypothetical protein
MRSLVGQTKVRRGPRVVRNFEIPSNFTPEKARAARRLTSAAQKGLTNSLALEANVEVDDKGRCANARSVVVPSVNDAAFLASLDDVRHGDGGELRSPESDRPPSFHSAYSSCALAINTFGLWRLNPSGLTIEARAGFQSLRFEAKFPINRRWRTAPNIDVVCFSSDAVIAIESKLTEHLSAVHTAEFRPGYEKVIENTAHSSWAEKYEELRRNPDYYAFFNAAQIIKHYLGLKADLERTIAGRSVTLLYLYWEPSDAREHALFADHRAAVSAFGEGLQDESVRFESASYPELWKRWVADMPSNAHLRELYGRYVIDLGATSEGLRPSL